MIDESTMYWMTRLDDIREFLRGMGIISTICGMVGLVVGIAIRLGVMTDSSEPRVAPVVRRALLICGGVLLLSFALWTAWALTPSTRDYAAIKVIPMLANAKLTGSR